LTQLAKIGGNGQSDEQRQAPLPAEGSFRKVVVSFLTKLLAEPSPVRRSPGAAGYLVRAHGIGELGRHGEVIYDTGHLASARSLLGRLRPKDTDACAVVLSVQADVATHDSHAATRSKPQWSTTPLAQSSVAMRIINADFALHKQAWFAAIPAQDAAAIGTDVVLVCETIMSLYACSHLSWVTDKLGGRATLAVFAGGKGLFRRAATAQLLAASNLPVLRLASFSPHGLLDAAGTPRLEGMCWPPRAQLEELALAAPPSGVHRAQMRRAANTLDACPHAAVQSAWDALKRVPGSVMCDTLLKLR